MEMSRKIWVREIDLQGGFRTTLASSESEVA